MGEMKFSLLLGIVAQINPILILYLLNIVQERLKIIFEHFCFNVGKLVPSKVGMFTVTIELCSCKAIIAMRTSFEKVMRS